MDEKSRKYFKLGLLAAVIIIVIISGFLIVSANASTTKTILFENQTYIFERDANFNEDVNIIGTITGSSVLKIKEGISTTDDSFNSLFDIFVAEAPNTVMASSIPQSTDNSLVIQRAGPQNINFIDVVFWDSDTNRPLLVINAGDAGRATTFERSLQVGKDFAVGILNLEYTLCEGTTLADCDTLDTGADLVVEDDIEGFGSLQVHENVAVDGNLSFTGAFGELFDSTGGNTITINSQDVFVPIDGQTTGNSSNTVLNDTNITIAVSGFYLANYTVSVQNGEELKYNTGVMVNSVTEDSGQATRKPDGQDTDNLAGTTILDLNVGDNVSLAIANLSNSSNITVDRSTLTITYIGS